MKPRNPQLTLRLDLGAPDPGARWCDGAQLAYLGRYLALMLDTERRTAALDGDVLHLPLPPAASPRQIRDGAETWLQSEITRIIAESMGRLCARRGIPLPPCRLSFATRGHWVQPDRNNGLRCNWRLIEQPLAVIEQALDHALATLPNAETPPDLFACAA